MAELTYGELAERIKSGKGAALQPNPNCRTCYGRGHQGKYFVGPQKGLYRPCKCLKPREEVGADPYHGKMDHG